MPQILQAETDVDGRFVLDKLPADCGFYSLAATPEGFAPLRTKLPSLPGRRSIWVRSS